MTKLVTSDFIAPATTREVRPFLYLDPVREVTGPVALDPQGLRVLAAATDAAVPILVRSLVERSIAQTHGLRIGPAQPIQLSVLNRRRRVARAWVQAVVAGRVDAGTQHAAGTHWLPTLTGSGPDLGQGLPGARALVEFVRGAVTAWLFDQPTENLLPAARALHVLETVLAVHLAAVVDASRRHRAV